MEAVHSDGWRVPIKLINVELSLASYRGDTLEIHTQVFPRDLEKYCIISYVWSHEDDFAVDEISKNKLDSERCDVTTKRTITSCNLASFVAMLDICDQMGMKHVWIDCVCVEQEIEGVKSLQLAEMGYYYSRATRCLVFLDGLNMYTPPIYQESKIGAWYDRVWIVQEAAYTYSKKIFVHALPPARTVLESSDIITFMRCRNEHVDLISRCLAQKKSRLVQDIPHDVSKWLLGLVYEENYPAFLNLLPNLSSEVRFCWTGWDRVVRLREKIMQSLNVKPNNVNLIIREALRGTRGCKFPQDRVYSIMTLLGIELDVSYSRSLRDTICKAAETMSPNMLVHFVTATWYSEDGHALPEVTENPGTGTVMGISNCITNIKVEGNSDLLMITTKTKSVTISRLWMQTVSFHMVADKMVHYPTYGDPFLVNDNVQARGEVSPLLYPGPASLFGSGTSEAKLLAMYPGPTTVHVKLLFMGTSQMKGFVVDGNGLMKDGPVGVEVAAHVCLVVSQVNAVWIKVGVLYVSEELIFESEPATLALKL